MAEKQRCVWAGSDPEMIAYHDEEWGKPVHDDRTLFEFLILEGAQAGLSWSTILHKRAAYRRAFANFDAAKIARFDAKKIHALMQDEGIVRNRAKIAWTVANAKALLKLQDELSLDEFMWSFVGGKPMVRRPQSFREVPASTPESDAMSKALKKRGFGFVGTTICYALMQACGLVDDHARNCFCAR